jgi:hypothetical protein
MGSSIFRSNLRAGCEFYTSTSFRLPYLICVLPLVSFAGYFWQCCLVLGVCALDERALTLSTLSVWTTGTVCHGREGFFRCPTLLHTTNSRRSSNTSPRCDHNHVMFITCASARTALVCGGLREASCIVHGLHERPRPSFCTTSAHTR